MDRLDSGPGNAPVFSGADPAEGLGRTRVKAPAEFDLLASTEPSHVLRHPRQSPRRTGPAGARGPPRIVPQRRTGQWTAAVAVLVLLGARRHLGRCATRRSSGTSSRDYFTSDAVLRGLWLTLWLTAVVMVLGFALGTLLAAFRLSANPVLRSVSWGYVWLFRSIPILVQLLLWFNIGALYPQILGVGRSTCSARSPSRHRPDAARGRVRRRGRPRRHPLRRPRADRGGAGARSEPWRRFRRIVLPQAMRSIVPPAGNMLIGTLKGTSIVSVIAVQDLLYSVQLVYHRTYEVIPLLLVATLWYAVITSLLGSASTTSNATTHAARSAPDERAPTRDSRGRSAGDRCHRTHSRQRPRAVRRPAPSTSTSSTRTRRAAAGSGGRTSPRCSG